MTPSRAAEPHLQTKGQEQGRHHRTSPGRRAGGTTRPPTTTRGQGHRGHPREAQRAGAGAAPKPTPGRAGGAGGRAKARGPPAQHFFVTLRKRPFPPLPGMNQIQRDSTQTNRPYISITIKSADMALPLPPNERKLPPLPAPPSHLEAPGAIPGASMPPVPPWYMGLYARVDMRAIDIVAPSGGVNFDSIPTVLAMRH